MRNMSAQFSSATLQTYPGPPAPAYHMHKDIAMISLVIIQDSKTTSPCSVFTHSIIMETFEVESLPVCEARHLQTIIRQNVKFRPQQNITRKCSKQMGFAVFFNKTNYLGYKDSIV